MLTRALDGFYSVRKHLMASITYTALRAYGFETQYKSVLNKRYDKSYAELNLDSVTDVDFVLGLAKDELAMTEKRREFIGSKYSQMTPLSLLLFCLSIALIPKYSDTLHQVIAYIAIGLALATVVLLLTFYDVINEQQVVITQSDANLDSIGLRKSLVNDYRCARNNKDSHTDYLVDVFSAARFYLVLCLISLAVLAVCGE